MERLASLEARSTRLGSCLMVPTTGYGEVCFGGNRMRAHRAAYTVHNGPIPAGMVVRHTCDNVGCIEPTHLIVGTYADNSRDAVERDRMPKGEDHPGVTAPGAHVAAAVADYLGGGRSQAEVARRHGVSQTTVGNWVRAETRRDSGHDGLRQGKGHTLARGLKPCGTKAAYQRHLGKNETPCEPCIDAYQMFWREYRAARTWRGELS